MTSLFPAAALVASGLGCSMDPSLVTDCANQSPGLSAVPTIDCASEYVYLQDNDISALDCSKFSCLSDAKKLDLSNNHVTAIPSSCFSGMGKMFTLVLTDCQLSSLPSDAFQGISNVRNLYMAGNSITSFSSAHLSGMPNLKHLTLSGNSITSLASDTFQSVTKLEKLQMNWNRLSALDVDLFRNLNKLTLLDLTGVVPTSGVLDNTQFDDLTSLEFLGLRSDFLTALTPRHLQALPRPLTLALGGNPFTCCPGLKWLKNEELAGSVVMDGGITGNYLLDPDCDDAAAHAFTDWTDFDDTTCTSRSPASPF